MGQNEALAPGLPLPRAAPGAGLGLPSPGCYPVVFSTKKRKGQGKEQMEVGLEGACTGQPFTFLKVRCFARSAASPLQRPGRSYRKEGRDALHSVLALGSRTRRRAITGTSAGLPASATKRRTRARQPPSWVVCRGRRRFHQAEDNFEVVLLSHGGQSLDRLPQSLQFSAFSDAEFRLHVYLPCTAGGKRQWAFYKGCSQNH